mgnify:CR=1 FL=1
MSLSELHEADAGLRRCTAFPILSGELFEELHAIATEEGQSRSYLGRNGLEVTSHVLEIVQKNNNPQAKSAL